MKIRKIITAVTAFTLVCGMPVFPYARPLTEVQAGIEIIETEEEYTVGIYENLFEYHKCSDHIEIGKQIDKESFTALEIPSEINGMPVTAIAKEVFFECTGLTSITIPYSVTTIKQGAFYSCTGLTSITIPYSVTTIKQGAFYDCSALTSITIPESITTVEDYVFRSCTSLTSVTIPDSVTTIGKFSFCECPSLTSITIPDSVTTIGMGAFNSCTGLTSMTIPNSIKTIDIAVFEGCDSLTDIYYSGTEEEWNNISIEDYGNDILNHVTIHFNSSRDEKNLSGDANLDGKVSISDAVAILQYLANAEKYPLDGQAKINADVDGAEGVTGMDAAVIQQYDAGIITEI